MIGFLEFEDVTDLSFNAYNKKVAELNVKISELNNVDTDEALAIAEQAILTSNLRTEIKRLEAENKDFELAYNEQKEHLEKLKCENKEFYNLIKEYKEASFVLEEITNTVVYRGR